MENPTTETKEEITKEEILAKMKALRHHIDYELGRPDCDPEIDKALQDFRDYELLLLEKTEWVEDQDDPNWKYKSIIFNENGELI